MNERRVVIPAPARTGLTRTTGARTRLIDPWRISLWAVQLLLAAVFGDDGFVKAMHPVEALTETFNWPAQVPEGLVRFIGGSELAAALGLVLPTATRILPYLTPFAALCLTLLMWAAFVFHTMRGEWQMLPVNVALGLLAAFVAWGRLGKAPVDSRFED
jgi:putative oxidoreductase